MDTKLVLLLDQKVKVSRYEVRQEGNIWFMTVLSAMRDKTQPWPLKYNQQLKQR